MVRKFSIDKKDMHRIQCILLGILVNIALSFILFKFEIPLFLDTIGTILVTMLGGSFLGISVGVLSNTVSALFNDISIYYGILNAMIAIITAYFFRKGHLKKVKGTILFILTIAGVAGVLGAIIQTLLIGAPQYRSIEETVRLLSDITGFNSVISFIIVNFFLNIVDKGISVGLAILFYRVFPQNQKDAIYKSEWRQKPFSLNDVKRVRELKASNTKHSLKGRMTVLLIFATLFLSFVMVWISVNLYYSNTKKEYTEQALNAVKFAAEIIDPDTGEVLPEGEKGELVFTSLDKEAFPLLRYRTRDICVLTRGKCSCGRTHVKMCKPMGRSDDMMIIRGVNVFPSQIETVLLNEGYTPNYMIYVDRKNNTDTLDIDVELTPEQFSDNVADMQAKEKSLAAAMRTMLGIGPKIHLVPPKTIQRSEGKAVRVIDNRKLH